MLSLFSKQCRRFSKILEKNPRFQDKFQCTRDTKKLRSDWMVAKFGQLLSVVIRFICVLYYNFCQMHSLVNPQGGKIWN